VGLVLAASALLSTPDALSADESGALPRPHALEYAAYYFRAKDGSVLTLLTLDFLKAGKAPGPVRDGEEPAYAGAASVEESGRRGEELRGATSRAVALEVAPWVARKGTASFAGQVYLQSGRNYLVRYFVKDAQRDEIFLRNSLLVVPYLSGGFSASSIVPAERFGPAGPRLGGFEVGSEEVVPKAGGVFRRQEKLRLYLQVYDAKPDPVTGATRVDLTFRFYRTVEGRSKRYGKPFYVRSAAGASMGLDLPIADWPAGSYRVEVDLHDRNGDGRITTEGGFSIADE
jgi:hypothetical protein